MIFLNTFFKNNSAEIQLKKDTNTLKKIVNALRLFFYGSCIPKQNKTTSVSVFDISNHDWYYVVVVHIL